MQQWQTPYLFAKLYDQAEVDALNEQVNNLRQTNVDQEAELTAANQRNAELEQQLADCKNQGPVIVTDTITSHKKTLESVVTFRQGGVSVVASQTPNVERIATYLKIMKRLLYPSKDMLLRKERPK